MFIDVHCHRKMIFSCTIKFRGLVSWTEDVLEWSYWQAWGSTVDSGCSWNNPKGRKPLGHKGFWLGRASLVGPIGTTMLHTHEVTGSSPVVSTKKKDHPLGGLFFLLERRQRTRTHFNATVRWTVAATSSKTGGNHNVIESCCLPSKNKANRVFGFRDKEQRMQPSGELKKWNDCDMIYTINDTKLWKGT